MSSLTPEERARIGTLIDGLTDRAETHRARADGSAPDAAAHQAGMAAAFDADAAALRKALSLIDRLTTASPTVQGVPPDGYLGFRVGSPILRVFREDRGPIPKCTAGCVLFSDGWKHHWTCPYIAWIIEQADTLRASVQGVPRPLADEIEHLRQGIAAYHADYEYWQSQLPHTWMSQAVEDWRERDRRRAEGRQVSLPGVVAAPQGEAARVAPPAPDRDALGLIARKAAWDAGLFGAGPMPEAWPSVVEAWAGIAETVARALPAASAPGSGVIEELFATAQRLDAAGRADLWRRAFAALGDLLAPAQGEVPLTAPTEDNR